MFYLVIFLILLLLSIWNVYMVDKPGNRIVTAVAALLLVLVAGLRYETGGDWDTYAKIFYAIPELSHLSSLENIYCEPGFCLLVSTVKGLGGNVQTLFFLISLFDITLITLALCRYTRYPVLGLLCYYGILYFSLEMIYVRQAMTVAMCFWAVHCIEDRQPIRYLIWVLVACMFHRVAVVMLLLYPLVRLRIPMWVYVVTIGLGVVLMLVGLPWISGIFNTVAGWLGGGFADKARVYSATGVFSVDRKLTLGFVLNLCIIAGILFFKEDIDRKRYGTLHLNMYVLSLLLYYYCYELVEVSNRFRLFFLISLIVLLPDLVEIMQVRWKKIVVIAVVVLYAFSFSRGIMLEAPQAAAYNPYQNYILYKAQGRNSTGKERLERSHFFFNKDRQ